MTLQANIANYIGAFTDTDALNAWLNRNARMLIDMVPLEKLKEYSTTATVTASGLTITAYRLISANKSGYPSYEINAEEKTRYSDSDSIYYALGTSPRHYIENGKLYIIPSGGSATIYTYPTSITYADETISGFPTGLVQPLVVKTAIDCAKYNAQAYLDEMATRLTADDVELVSSTMVKFDTNLKLINSLNEEFTVLMKSYLEGI